MDGRCIRHNNNGHDAGRVAGLRVWHVHPPEEARLGSSGVMIGEDFLLRD